MTGKRKRYSAEFKAKRLSVAQSVDFCVEAVEEALTRHGKPEIFSTDQGGRFSNEEFVTLPPVNRIARNSMGICLDFYNRRRPHPSLDGRTPDQVHFDARSAAKAA